MAPHPLAGSKIFASLNHSRDMTRQLLERRELANKLIIFRAPIKQ